MVSFLDGAVGSKKEALTRETLKATIADGADRRVRPVFMTAATILTLLLIPAIYSLFRGWEIRREG